MKILANAEVGIILQGINESNQHFVQLKLTKCYVSIMSQ